MEVPRARRAAITACSSPSRGTTVHFRLGLASSSWTTFSYRAQSPYPSQSVGQANIALQDPQLDPLQNGYHKESDGQLKPTMTDALPAPKAIIEMVSCQCKRDCSSARCSCRTNNLACTNLCQCGSECKNDEDTQTQYETDDDDDVMICKDSAC